jgi:hypothetical protein
MKIKLAPDKIELIEIFQGKSLGMTFNSDLKKGLLYHFTCTRISENPIFNFLVNEVCSLGNIYFEYIDDGPQKIKTIYYPAAYLFIIRIPITDNNIDAATKALSDNFLYRLATDVYDSKLIIDYKNGKTIVNNIMVLELIVPMAFLYETVQWIVNQDLILKEKLYRAIIQDSLQKALSAGQIFTGTEKDEWSSYSISYKPMLPLEDKNRTI